MQMKRTWCNTRNRQSPPTLLQQKRIMGICQQPPSAALKPELPKLHADGERAVYLFAV
jgi:hypothetical protein